jgi:hypothetical protein
MDAESVGHELVVSAWPEPPSAKFAGARCGEQGTFAVAGVESANGQGGRRSVRIALNLPAFCRELPEEHSEGVINISESSDELRLAC